MPKFADYAEAVSPLASDTLLIDNTLGTNTRKLTIANLLNRGIPGRLSKFNAQDGLANSLLSERVAPDGSPTESKLLYNLDDPILTGGTKMNGKQFNHPATVSINGNLAARATNSEFYFENNWFNQNTMALRNTYVGNGSFSTLRVLERGGWEMGTFGYGNTAATAEETAAYPWYESIYIETGNPNRDFIMKDAAGKSFPPKAPSPLRFIQSGVIADGFNGSKGYFYVRQEFVPNGDIHFYDVSAPFNQRAPSIKIGRDGRFHVTPKVGADAMIVQNRSETELSTIKFLTSTGRTAGAFGYGNARSPAPDLQDTFYILTDGGSADAPPPPFKIMQFGKSPGNEFFKTRFVVASNGRIIQTALPGVPADAELFQPNQVVFYLDEAAGKLMVKARFSNGAYRSGELASLS